MNGPETRLSRAARLGRSSGAKAGVDAAHWTMDYAGALLRAIICLAVFAMGLIVLCAAAAFLTYLAAADREAMLVLCVALLLLATIAAAVSIYRRLPPA